MKKTLWKGLLLCGLLACQPAQAASGDDDGRLDEFQTRYGNEWHQIRHDSKRNITTWMRQEDGKTFRSFKVQAELDGSMEAVARLMLDFPGYDKWYWQVMEAKLLKQVSATEYVVYLVHRAPAGLPNRDVVLRGSVQPQTRSQKTLTLRIVAEPDYLPLKPPMVRMPAQEVTSRFMPMENGKVMLETEGYVDPGGKIPLWAANFVQRSAPYAIVLAMQRRLQSGDYDKGRPLPFPVYGSEDYRQTVSR
ncbi:MAG: START domain-containing protein [Fluviicoccus sp.]|uniref:START domain-containing protein n=1 Tax=Fluviicoccus sp. TaxID=2003552 RepID=UPI0027232E21|nr:START domain-containing protein [Fluviicoccus sp.]MDO8332069.1 START domain-containing protein [Fluviicoccus sp.]